MQVFTRQTHRVLTIILQMKPLVCSVTHRNPTLPGVTLRMAIFADYLYRGTIMNTSISFSLSIVGILLFIWGFSISESASSDISRLFTGSPTDKSVWLMIGGVGVAIIGLFGIIRRP
jgi:hypothetical protein